MVDAGFKQDGQPMRRFYLQRIKDQTGVSRTGRVLEGVLTQSGQVIVQWRPPHASIGIYGSMQEFLTIHVDCHPSCSAVIWIDADKSWERGWADAYQDRCEGCAGASLRSRPSYIGDSEWPEYTAGYRTFELVG